MTKILRKAAKTLSWTCGLGFLFSLPFLVGDAVYSLSWPSRGIFAFSAVTTTTGFVGGILLSIFAYLEDRE